MKGESVAEIAVRLRGTGYICDESLATMVFLAQQMQRPLLLEGEPGTGKTALAEAVAESLGLPLIRLQCYEGIDASQALYDWDFPRQILHLRALEASGGTGLEEAEKSLYDARFLLARPILAALQDTPAVLLIDEVDRADDEFEAFLLEVLSTWQVTIPEFGTVKAATPPFVVLTSNRTREIHDALKRRCLYHWIDHPGLERELEIVRSRAPEVSEALGRQVVLVVQQLRTRDDLLKPPGVAETLDWARALERLGTTDLDLSVAAATLGALVKYREDTERVKLALDQMLTDMTAPRGGRDPARLRRRGAGRRSARHRRPHPRVPRGGRVGRLRRPAGHLARRSSHAVRRSGRPRALRPGVRGLVPGPRGPAHHQTQTGVRGCGGAAAGRG